MDLEQRKAICLDCRDFQQKNGAVLFCGRECHRPDGAYCERWAADRWRKRLSGEASPCVRWSDETMFKVISESCGHGRLSADGCLGYVCDQTGHRVLLPDRIRYDRVLSAHAPSEVVVEITEPVTLAGAANASFSGDSVSY